MNTKSSEVCEQLRILNTAFERFVAHDNEFDMERSWDLAQVQISSTIPLQQIASDNIGSYEKVVYDVSALLLDVKSNLWLRVLSAVTLVVNNHIHII